VFTATPHNQTSRRTSTISRGRDRVDSKVSQYEHFSPNPIDGVCRCFK
jgi:hypothetical protein